MATAPPPSVTAQAASSITNNTAVLNGTSSSNGSVINAEGFGWGTVAWTTGPTPPYQFSNGAGTTVSVYSMSIASLTPGTLYWAWAWVQDVATGSLYWSSGVSFTTNTFGVLSTLVDKLDTTTRNASLWTQDTSTGTMSYSSAGASATIPNTTLNPSYARMHSVTSYNLTGSYIMIEVPSAPVSQVVDSYLRLGSDGGSANQTGLFMTLTNGTMTISWSSAGAYHSIWSFAYNAKLYRFWRIREQGGRIYFEWSYNGVVWAWWSWITTPITITALPVHIGSYAYPSNGVNVVSAAPFTWKNVNIIQSSKEAFISLF